jgi:hypothetical protein
LRQDQIAKAEFAPQCASIRMGVRSRGGRCSKWV